MVDTALTNFLIFIIVFHYFVYYLYYFLEKTNTVFYNFDNDDIKEVLLELEHFSLILIYVCLNPGNYEILLILFILIVIKKLIKLTL